MEDNNNKTGMIYSVDGKEKLLEEPRLFVCFEKEILEFTLAERQSMGRPAEGEIPDIPIPNSYVSRGHGYFTTKGKKVSYTAQETTNSIFYKEKSLKAGETVTLSDGDELVIPISEAGEKSDILIVFVQQEKRARIWRELRMAAVDSLTQLPGGNSFRVWFLQRFLNSKAEEASLFLLEIDQFKQINDSFGHDVGDQSLKRLSTLLQRMVGKSGYVCRLTDQEFAGIMLGPSGRCRRELAGMSASFSEVRINKQFNASLNIGIVELKGADGQEDIDELLENAREALTVSRGREGVNICVYGK